ncbi:MAG: asparaginase [Clostridia bacterium]|nr:asparaginase [Clostridia bacterium]
MKILVIFTGGTIGSSIKKGWADIDNDTQYLLLSKYNDNNVEFVTSSPFSVLSENLSAKHLNLLQKEIKDNLEKDFDGIIVTHGTDTLQYSATAIEYAFNGCELPIVFVSADYPLEDEKTNGFINFETAVEFIKSKSAKGVFVSYKNNDEVNANIHIASRILQHSEYDANIYSIDNVPFATYSDKIELNNIKLDNTNNIGVVDYVENPCVLSVESYPGNNYSYCLDNVNAVILKPYHSGTLDTANSCLKDFCNRANEKNIPVFLTGTYDGVSYKSTAVYSELGVKIVPFSTYVSAYMKIWAGISLSQNLEDVVNKQIANEYI